MLIGSYDTHPQLSTWQEHSPQEPSQAQVSPTLCPSGHSPNIGIKKVICKQHFFTTSFILSLSYTGYQRRLKTTLGFETIYFVNWHKMFTVHVVWRMHFFSIFQRLKNHLLWHIVPILINAAPLNIGIRIIKPYALISNANFSTSIVIDRVYSKY